jgi:hypothetical protein
MQSELYVRGISHRQHFPEYTRKILEYLIKQSIGFHVLGQGQFESGAVIREYLSSPEEASSPEFI